jgi:undecaprenyl-diphosphatase
MNTPPANVSPTTAQQESQTHQRSLWRGYALLVGSLAAFAVFGLMAFLVRGLAPLEVDIRLTQIIQTATLAPPATGTQVPIYDELMEFVSTPGFWPYNLIVPAIIVAALLVLRRVAEAVFTIIALGGVQIAVEMVKAVIQRPRPLTIPGVHFDTVVAGYSFPSGHVAGYVCLYGFLFYLAWTQLHAGPARTAILVLTGALIVLVGPSRIYEGQHWASDVLGGYTLGFGLLMLVIWAYRRWEVRHTAAEAERAASG